MLRSFGFSLLIWGIFHRFLLNDRLFSWSLELQLVISQTQPVHMEPAVGSPHSLNSNIKSTRLYTNIIPISKVQGRVAVMMKSIILKSFYSVEKAMRSSQRKGQCSHKLAVSGPVYLVYILHNKLLPQNWMQTPQQLTCIHPQMSYSSIFILGQEIPLQSCAP